MPIATHSMDESMERPISRFVIGIDLGTTNCAVAYVDTLQATPTVETFRIEQLVDWSSVESRDTLPSFHYQLTDQEANSVQNRWIDRGTNSAAPQSTSVQPSIVGALARDRGLEIPGRQISSAKSWLCHSGVDRTAAFLPWHGDEGVELLSPVEASASYLRYLRYAWDRAFSAHPMADQDVVVTLPASFDEVARELTVEAAKLAGLPRIVLGRASGCLLRLAMSPRRGLDEQDCCRQNYSRLRYRRWHNRLHLDSREVRGLGFRSS